MAILKTKDVRKLKEKEMENRLAELKLEMAKERANISIGATTTSPGKIKEIRRTIARIETVRRENETRKPLPASREVN